MPRLPFIRPEPQIAEDSLAELDAPAQTGLHLGLRAIPIRRPTSAFNAAVLAAMSDERRHEPFMRAAVRRIRWMLVPALLGLISTLAISRMPPPVPAAVALAAPQAAPSDAPPLPEMRRKLAPIALPVHPVER